MITPLALFARDDQIQDLEFRLQSPDSEGLQPRLRLCLAWYLRQRDPARAQSLAADLEQDPELPLPARARLLLMQAEWKLLQMQIPAATALADIAEQAFAAQHDRIGQADADWLLGMIAIERGDWPGMAAAMDAAAAAVAGVDAARVDTAQAAQAYFCAFRDREAALARWGERFGAGEQGLDPVAACWAEDFLAVCKHHASDFVPAIGHFMRAYTLALETGQIRRAVISATNTGDALNHLNDYQGALTWMQRGLTLAERAGWSGSRGVALLQTAHTLRKLQQWQASREMLHEALEVMSPLLATRNRAYALWNLGEVELATGQHAAALACFVQLAERSNALAHADLQSSACSGQAQALLGLGQAEPALAAANEALRLAAGVANLQISALRVISAIHLAHPMPRPAGMAVPSAPLHFLQQALSLAEGIERLTVPPELLEELAHEHARLGDLAQAYAMSLRAGASRQVLYSQESSNRAMAMRMTHETDRARAEAEHQKQSAKAQAERLLVLEQLGVMGREITRQLDAAGIFATLDQHLHSLLDVPVLVVYRLVPGASALALAFGRTDGPASAPQQVALDDAMNPVAECARTGQDFVLHLPAPAASLLEQAVPHDLICAPLLAGERLLGVMGIQSAWPQTLGERELAIFRTLAAYGAIALANAEVQQQLVEKNRALERLSRSDALTGLHNRFHLDQVLGTELLRRNRSGAPLSVVMLDLDRFKAVNDTHGHPVGDQVLVQLAEVLRRAARELDAVGRWGGEEFLIVCQETDLQSAAVLAERLCSLIAAQAFPAELRCTASFGVATLRDTDDIEALVARADAALYRAKRAGRNRVELDGQPGTAAAVLSSSPSSSSL